MNLQRFTLIYHHTAAAEIYTLSLHDALPISNTKEKAYIASMKSDLRNMVTAEEAYFDDSRKCRNYIHCANSSPAGSVAKCATTGNSLQANPTVGTGTQAGWTVAISNLNTAKSCAIYVGAVTPVTPATTTDPEGAPVCR